MTSLVARERPQTRIVIMSGYWRPNGTPEHVAAVLRKPCPTTDVIKQVERACEMG